MSDEDTPKTDPGGENRPVPEGGEVAKPPSARPAWLGDLDTYPSRDPSEDPRWALWLFWIWMTFAVASIAFMVALLVLGWYYD